MNPETDKIVQRLRDDADGVMRVTKDQALAIDLRQAANTIEDLQKVLAFVSDIAQNGLRCDLHPTMILDDEECSMYSRMQQYLERQDKSMRERARQALAPA